MDHFAHSMAVRKRIMEDAPLMKKLSGHFLGGGKLAETIGNGTNNIHYRVGMLEGLWVATREQFQVPLDFNDPARTDPVKARFHETGNYKTLEAGIFCKEAYCWAEFGGFGVNRSVASFVENGGPGYATSFSIAVRYKPMWRDTPLHALLVEDLTGGGAFRLEPEKDSDWSARIPGVDGLVQIDLDDGPKWRKRHPEVPDYLSEQAIIDFGSG
jgi:hypothetical protein